MRDTYISPFFSLSAKETAEELEERLLALRRTGIYSVTIEYQNSGENDGGQGLGRGCFATLDRLVKVCAGLGMQFRIQDAAPFPTGNAGGALNKAENTHLRKLYIGECHMDVTGPYPQAAIPANRLICGASLQNLFGPGGKELGKNLSARKPLCIVACRFGYDSVLDEESGELLFDAGCGFKEQASGEYCQKSGLLYWDIPEGHWRIFGVYTTTEGGGRPDYVNLLDRDSVKLQISSVHEPIYEHLKEELGKTWDGFFYDELEIGNTPGYDFFMLPGGRGKKGKGNDVSVLPWSRELQEIFLETGSRAADLPLLWYDGHQRQGKVRFRYMDSLTRLAGEAYNGQVHKWCRERNVPYTGHVLEDENSHTRLGCGTGHYFRIQKHQDMSGVDMIGGQVMPENDCRTTMYGYLNSDGKFSHYGLAKLASSAAHIDPGKRGRSLCEVFALYGTVCSVRLRKFVIDHLLVNGINHLIYADAGERGTPSAWMKRLNDYTNVMCGLLNQTKAVIQTAILYHAESEWSGQFQYFQDPAAELARHQISYDVIPADVFEDAVWYQTEVTEGLCINGNRYQALIIPYCQYLPKAVAEFVQSCRKTGFPVFFTDEFPEGICGEVKEETDIKREDMEWFGQAVALDSLAQAVKGAIVSDFVTDKELPWLRYSHLRCEAGDYYFLHNESRLEKMKFRAEMEAGKGHCYRIDMMTGNSCKEDGPLQIVMEPFESQLYFYGEQLPEGLVPGGCNMLPAESSWWGNEDAEKERRHVPHERPWEITLWHGEEQMACLPDSSLININGKGAYPGFAGKIVYRSEVEFGEWLPEILELGKVYEACDVYWNGEFAGTCIGAPFRVEIGKLVHSGTNQVIIEVHNSEAHDKGKETMPLSMISGTAHTFLEPGGLLGPVEYW